MMRHLVTTAVAALLFMGSAASAGDAGREMPFTVGAGARAIGMGGAYTSLARDAYAIYYNPAGLANLEWQEIGLMHTDLFQGTIYDVAAWVVPIDERHGLGIGYMRVGTKDIIRREDFADVGRFNYGHSQIMLSYGRDAGSVFSFGVNLKIVHQVMDDRADYGVGIDGALMLSLSPHVTASVVGRDLFPAELQVGVESEKLPRSVAGGLGITELALSPFVNFSIAADVEKSDDREMKYHVGSEVSFHHKYALRLGYDRDNVAFGAGLKFGRMNFDYAYKLVDYVEDTHHFSLTFRLGTSVSEKIRLREMAQREPELTEEEKVFIAIKEEASRFFHLFQLDSAQYYYLQALQIEPENQEIIGSIAAIERTQRVQAEQEEELRKVQQELTQTLASFLSEAESMSDRGLYQASLALLDLIFDIDPNNAWASDLKARTERAMEAQITTSLTLGRTAEQVDDYVGAIEALNRVLELDPGNTEADSLKQQVLAAMGLPERVKLGVEFFERGHFISARTQFKSILETRPDEPTAIDYLERIRKALTRTPTLEDLQKDQQIWTLYLDGLRHMRYKEYQRAIDSWQRVLEKYPDNPETTNNIEQARLRLEAQEGQ